MRSFRSALALRVAVQALALSAVVLVGATLLLRAYLLSAVDSSLRGIAEIEGQTGASKTDDNFTFHTGSVPRVPDDPRPELTPWAQLLRLDGVPEAWSTNLVAPIPVPARAIREARTGKTTFATHDVGGVPVRSVIYPMHQASALHAGHLLQVTTSLAPMRSTMTTFIWLLAVLSVLGTGMAWAAGWAIAGRALKPALEITAEAESIGINELGRRVTENRDLIEFNRMAVAFNALLQRVEQAVTGTRRFTSDASHELRAPLTVLRGELELALTRPRSAADYEDVIRRCLDEVLRLVRLADDMLTLTRVEGGVVGSKRAAVDLDDVVARSMARKAALADTRGVTVSLSGTAGTVLGDADLLLRAVDGLLEHAIMASPREGQVRLDLAEGSGRYLQVTDSGPGIGRDEVSGVFQRFYRSNRPRSASEESGLGLAIARAVALSHGGTFEYVGNDPGASFRLCIPSA
ncbi:MAG TPA: ATP-binding protein, partial [Gemmatimonadales bacterium]|jgi:Signal transduction histidine kinase